MSEATKTLAELFIDALRTNALDTHTCMPAKVKAYDANLQKADIEPLLKKKYKFKEKPVNLPVITNIPVQWTSAGGGNAFIHLPLKAGDLGIIVFSERSIDIWLSGSGEAVYPNDPRHHDLSDAIFVPGVRPFKAALTISDPDSLIIKSGSAEIEITSGGEINILGGKINLGSGVEAAVKGDTLASLYASHTHSGVMSGASVTGTPSNVLDTALSGKVNLE